MLALQGVKSFGSLGIVLMAADIQPVAGKELIIYRLARLQEKFHQVREVQVCTRWNEIPNLWFKDVNSHAYQVGGGRFLHIVVNAAVPISDDHPQVYFYFTLIGGNGRNAPLLSMITKQFLVIQIGQNIRVHYQEGLVQVFDQGQRAGRPQRLGLIRIIELNSPFGPLLKISPDQFREIAYSQGNPPEPVGLELADNDLHDGHPAQRDQGFGDHLGEGG